MNTQLNLTIFKKFSSVMRYFGFLKIYTALKVLELKRLQVSNFQPLTIQEGRLTLVKK